MRSLLVALRWAPWRLVSVDTVAPGGGATVGGAGLARRRLAGPPPQQPGLLDGAGQLCVVASRDDGRETRYRPSVVAHCRARLVSSQTRVLLRRPARLRGSAGLPAA